MTSTSQQSPNIIIQAPPRWLCKNSAAAYLEISVRQLERLIQNGYLSVSRINRGHVRLDRIEIDRLMEQIKVNFKKQAYKILKI